MTTAEVIRRQALDAERQIATILGDRRFSQLKSTLAVLVGAIAPDAIAFDEGVQARRRAANESATSS